MHSPPQSPLAISLSAQQNAFGNAHPHPHPLRLHLNLCPQLSPQPRICVCKSTFTIDKPSWCVEPTKLVKLEDLSTGRTFDVGSRAFYVVGRNEKASIVLESLCVSRCHAALLHHSSGETYLMDLGSAHGTFVGQERLVPYIPSLIRKGSLIRFGSCREQYLLREYPRMDQVLQDAQTCNTTEERCVLINTHLNRYVAYSCDSDKWTSASTKDEQRLPNRSEIMRRDTLESVSMHEASDSESSRSSSSCSSAQHMEMSISLPEHPPEFTVNDQSSSNLRRDFTNYNSSPTHNHSHLPPRKRVRFSRDIPDEAFPMSSSSSEDLTLQHPL